ncbi:hypothetical protein GobsT_29020 [Gemmata obscuriglobus]|uniref:DUF1697 domain-containing protein n=1 Tax=Gemmata obscuriglobus TaxID=114 RepID=A0A2Z3HCA8_9BACT|nr:DUF1697 domain-containing protein [Gemmata obscuriglobus]AWM38870.1 DUF1697 domain-containing protein [Gemmata obscuriglobus]QEG28128.1 hypothetical protein GobsT_29020 [Gemmata obscuriglobus]VTS05789.1 Putative uncharacterized protein OS=Mesorhizobium alhagi CCNWXJ12-2 GN=MAXJ12_21494 PE=4 SV=1: DUF1697 [Gemmata obscuriglobus UQM 2246]
MPKPKTAYIILFRGVGGATQLPVAPLRAALTGAGFENVATYINSGNAVLRSHLARKQVIATAAKLCEEKFGFTKAIYAPTLEEWEALIANNPFPDFKEGKHVHAVVLGEVPKAESLEALRTHAVEGEAIELVGGVVYLHTPFGLGTSKLGEKFDKGIGVPNTARNWNTVLKLRELAKKAAGG